MLRMISGEYKGRCCWKSSYCIQIHCSKFFEILKAVPDQEDMAEREELGEIGHSIKKGTLCINLGMFTGKR